MATSKKQVELEARITDLTNDLQRTRADFENYRKRVESEKIQAREAGEMAAIMKLLPIIDNIERAIGYLPDELKGNPWAESVGGLLKSLDKSLAELRLSRIDAAPGMPFDPELHEAVQIDEASSGDHEVIDTVLRSGYLYKGRPLRHAMVKVTRAD